MGSRRPVRLATRLFTPEVGAAAFRVRVLGDSFADLGYPVEVVTTTPPADAPRIDGALQVSRWPALRDETGNIRGYLQYLSFDLPLFARLLARRPPALLVAEPPPTTGVVVRLVSTLQRVPFAYYAGDVWSDGAASMGAPRPVVAALRRVEAWVLGGASTVLCVSDGVAERVLDLGVSPERVVMVGNGVDTDTFTLTGPVAAAEGHCFVYTGTMSEWQGAEVLVRAVALCRRTIPDAKLIFFGQGSDVAHLRRLADEVAPDAVEFRGVVPPEEAARWLRAANAAVVSIRPGQGYDFAKPTKVYAATACGTPVIFAGAGAGHELVVSQDLGWSPGYDAGALADAMREAASLGDVERERLAIHLRAWTVENASLQTVGRAAAQAALKGALLH